eukprot:scaffold361_cov248-Pinguiococcus_pyrenoidosus.AAC.31
MKSNPCVRASLPSSRLPCLKWGGASGIGLLAGPCREAERSKSFRQALQLVLGRYSERLLPSLQHCAAPLQTEKWAPDAWTASPKPVCSPQLIPAKSMHVGIPTNGLRTSNREAGEGPFRRVP